MAVSSAETPQGLFATRGLRSVHLLGFADMHFNTPLVSTLLCLACTAVLAFPASGDDANTAADTPAPLERRNYSPSAPYFVEYFDAYASGVTGAPPVADVSVS